MTLIYLSEATSGGIAPYSVEQVRALAESGVEVLFLHRPGWDPGALPTGVRTLPVLPALPERESRRFASALGRVGDMRHIAATVEQCVSETGCRWVLWSCYSEYLSPFWAPAFRRLTRQGVRIGVVAHDPVRDFQLGPRWFHRWSIRQAYSFIADVFVHDETEVDFGGLAAEPFQVYRIPHGPYAVSEPVYSREQMRRQFGFSMEDVVFLSFGQIRDGKNLDLFLRAMTGMPERVKLLVAGSGDSVSQRAPAFYQELAEELGVAERCRWQIGYVPDEEVGNYFAVADVGLLTYSAKFRSASGVLNAAVTTRTPVMASSGPGPLKSVVRDYDLGVWVEPDSVKEIARGVERFLEAGRPEPQWEAYLEEHSWRKNAEGVRNAFER